MLTVISWHLSSSRSDANLNTPYPNPKYFKYLRHTVVCQEGSIDIVKHVYSMGITM